MISSVELGNAVLALRASKIDADTTPGYIRVYAGSPPVNAGDITDQTLLWESQISAKPCYSSIADKVMTLVAVPEQLILLTGTAAFAMITDGAGNHVCTATVGVKDAPTAGARYEIEVPTLDFIKGAYLRIPSAKIREQ